jgi:hypothetical protein
MVRGGSVMLYISQSFRDVEMKMRDTRYLEERLAVLEDLQKRSRGETIQPQVCASCYFVRDGEDGCLCNSTSWTIITVVIVQILNILGEVQREERENRSSAA